MNKSGKRRSGHICAVKNCKNRRSKCNESFFTFPKDPQRSKNWAILCSREDLLEESEPENLFKKYRICAGHFESKCFLNDLRNRLQPTAVPTIFPGLIDESPLDHTYCAFTVKEKFDIEVNEDLLSTQASKSKIIIQEGIIVRQEHDKHLITGPNKCENTTNMQENETSDKENISISITKEQLEQKCRTCFIRNGTINVFTKDHEGILFCDLLEKFSLAEIHQSDGLPQRICTYCSSFIINVCTFKKEIDKSLIKLKAALRQFDNQNIPESQCEGSDKSKPALRQLNNLNIPESHCEVGDKSKAALRQLDNLNIPESQCEESGKSKVSRKVVENFKMQVYVEGKEDNESKNEIIQQIVVAPYQDNNKNKYINKDSESTRSALEESHFDGPNADSGGHNNFRSLLNNISNMQRKYLRTRKLLMSQILKRSNTSALLDHNYIKSVDRKNGITNKKRGKEKKKEKLCPYCKKGQKFRINMFLNRQICFHKYSHCDKYTCTYCQSKNSFWLKYGAHNRDKHRNKHFYT
ncbi:uncharacterized protein [Diabrotica undecimpunctata]|uniref:uncharacterized protein n=1 Tax=Diabrotica undecimpunctata TaxID=50387 RepID=UPI003B641AD7